MAGRIRRRGCISNLTMPEFRSRSIRSVCLSCPRARSAMATTVWQATVVAPQVQRRVRPRSRGFVLGISPRDAGGRNWPLQSFSAAVARGGRYLSRSGILYQRLAAQVVRLQNRSGGRWRHRVSSFSMRCGVARGEGAGQAERSANGIRPMGSAAVMPGPAACYSMVFCRVEHGTGKRSGIGIRPLFRY